jgi:hypothetical protein
MLQNQIIANDQGQMGYPNQGTPLQPTHGRHVYYKYKQFTDLDEHDRKIAISINLFMIGEMMVMEKVSGDILLKRMTFTNPRDEIMNNDDLTQMERNRYFMIHTDYFLWNYSESPDATEREERIRKVLEDDLLGKTLKFVFRKVPNMVYENTSEIKNLFFLSLSHVTLYFYDRSFDNGKTTRDNVSRVRIISEDNPSTDDDQKEPAKDSSNQIVSGSKNRLSNSFYSVQQIGLFSRNDIMRNNLLHIEIPQIYNKNKSLPPFPVMTMPPRRMDRRLNFIYKIFSPN